MSSDKYQFYLQYCKTPRQHEILTHLAEGNNFKQVANILGLSSGGTVYNAYRAVKVYAESLGAYYNDGSAYDIDEDQFVKGYSTLYDETGAKKLEWVKTSKSYEDEVSKLKTVVDALKTKDAIAPPTVFDARFEYLNSELLNVYLLSDYHLGMMAWGEETGDEDWDMKIAREKLINWFSKMIASSPNAEECIFAQLGDFLHWDGLDAITPAHGNILDADTRFQKMIRLAIEVISDIVQMLLQKYKYVHLLMAEGNHDESGSAWLREFLSFHYSQEPRISVDTSPQCYYAYQHGDVSLFFHHGHRKDINGISDVFASRFRRILGNTRYSYAHIGHKHIKEVKETPLMVVERHRTLAAKDAYAGSRGFDSGRSSDCITYHRDNGEVARNTISCDMI